MYLSVAHMPASAGAAVFFLRMVLAATVIWLLAAVVTLLLRRSSASLRHRIWSMSMAAAFSIPPLVALAPQWEVAHFGRAAVGAAAMPTAEVTSHQALVDRVPAALSTAAERAEPDAAKPLLSNPESETNDDALSSPAAPPSIIRPLASHAAPVEAQRLQKHIPWFEYLTGVWLTVGLWLLVRQGASLFIAAAVVRRAPMITDCAARDALARLASKLNLSSQPSLRQSDEVRTPICVGYVWPCIVLPMDHVHWDNDQRAAALTHELAHVVRRDVAWQTLARLACAAWWFHPLAWIAAWRMRVERELACDDWVLRAGESSTRYARWLVDMAASLAGRSRSAERVGVAMARPHGFQARLSAILDPRRRRDPLSRRATLLLSMAAAALLVPLAVLNPLASTRAAGTASPPATQPVPPATRPAVQVATQPADDADRPRRSTRLKFVDAVTGEPVVGIKGNYWSDQPTSSTIQRYTSDEHGEATFTYPADARLLGFFVHKDDFVEGLVTIGDESGSAPLSDNYRLRLQHGLTIGGIVQDEQGNGISGVGVGIDFDFRAPDKAGYFIQYHYSAKTDALGRWTYRGAPAQPGDFRIFASHPDFVMDSFDHQYESGRFSDLAAKNLVSVIRRGVSIIGNAVDPEGRPVPRAEIAIGGFGPISGTYTDEHGHFVLRGVEPGPRDIAARVEGFAPQLKSLDVVPGLAPVEIRFEKGRALRVRVVDPQGKAVPSANVVVRKWRNVDMSGTHITADSGSRFVWDNAPPDEVILYVGCSRDLFQPREVTAVAGDSEVVVTLTPQYVPPATRPAAPATQPAIHTRLIGNVVDAETGKPIEKFSVKVAVTQGGLTRTIDGSGSNGRYEVNAIDSGVCSFKIHVIADGYLRADDSGRFINYRGAVRCDYQFDARLIRGGASGSILMPDGKPAEGVDVGLIDGVRWTPNISTVTDAAGRFMLPPRTGQIKLMLSHDSGWNFVKTEASASLQNLPLRPWCRVEGVLMKGDKPWPRQTIDLRPTTAFGDSLIERQNYRNEATTDANGKFTIEHVIDGTSEVGVELAVSDNGGRQAIEFTHAVPLNLKPGESKAGIQIGGTGRPIVGHVIVGNDLKAKGLRKVDVGLYLASPPFVPPPSYDSMSEQDRKRILQQYMQTEEHQRYQKRVKDYRAPVNADGSFRIEDVPAGDYTLYVAVWGRLPEFESYSVPRAEARLKVTVPDMPGGRSDTPLDVGPLDLKPLPYPEAGEMVPEFEGADFNKGRIKLSDYRGKYVLLNFWATGDTTSIEEFKKLEDLNQAYAADPRFVMIGVSLDKGADEPAKYLLDRKLSWPQAYGGRSVSKTFGILRVPSVWLIGPDGRIIARGGPDWYVDRAVKQALQTK